MKPAGIAGLLVVILVVPGLLLTRPHESCVDDTSVFPQPEQLPSGSLLGLGLETVATGLEAPSDVTQLPESSLLAVTEKAGRIVLIEDGVVLDKPLLDIRDAIRNDWNEQGLLTVETHPGYAETCLIYLFYTDIEGHSRIVEAKVRGSSPPTLEPNDLKTILLVEQVHQYHQSGSMVFGPQGHLWVSIGDGGGTGDKHGHGQNPATLKGSVVRLDLSSRTYRIPSDNPFVGGGVGRPEVWAFGVRNPWRISIDAESGLVFIPDVGETRSEEINVVSLEDAGANFGWSVTEGSNCYLDTVCDPVGITMPVYEFGHDGTGCAVVGGQVYRGRAIPELHGHYFFSDFCSGWLRSITHDGRQITSEFEWDIGSRALSSISSFGTDSNGELLVTTLDGQLMRIVPIRES